MRILITGSRDWPDPDIIARAILELNDNNQLDWDTLVIVHGDCPTGADAMAEQFAQRYDVQTERHPADWKAFGKFAGPKRNQEMVDLGANVCLAFPMAGSRGTMHCIKAAKAAGIPVKIYPYTTRDEEAFT